MVDYKINYEQAVRHGLVLRKSRTQEKRQKDFILRQCQLQLIDGRCVKFNGVKKKKKKLKIFYNNYLLL